ncbi:MAG: hypothetical protein F7O42_08535 [Opitutae bacterium]|nr:hypothetical protein [Opitutae bacterium]
MALSIKLFWGSLGLAILALGGLLGVAFLKTGLTIQKLLTENRQLKEAIALLTTEEQIGYAKVTHQEMRNGTLYTTLKFVETARNNPLETVFEGAFTLEGDVAHFDALKGRGRSLYLWRRVYGEKMAPSEGFPIEAFGREPERYRGLLNGLSLRERDLFWSEIWDLAHDLRALQEYGIVAVYGSAVYTQLKPGLVYIFKISPTGQVFPETIPDL